MICSQEEEAKAKAKAKKEVEKSGGNDYMGALSENTNKAVRGSPRALHNLRATRRIAPARLGLLAG